MANPIIDTLFPFAEGRWLQIREGGAGMGRAQVEGQGCP